MKIRMDKKWIKTQLEALPYIGAAVLLCGVLWLLISLTVIVLG